MSDTTKPTPTTAGLTIDAFLDRGLEASARRYAWYRQRGYVIERDDKTGKLKWVKEDPMP